MNTDTDNLMPTGRGKSGGSDKAGNSLPDKYSGISPYLSREELVFVKLSLAKRVTELTQAEAEKAILELMNRGYAELGQTPQGTGPEERQRYMSAMAKLIITDLEFYFPCVTMAEVAMATKNGIRHQYGEYFGFNVISIHGFVEKYLASEEREAALVRQERYRQSQEVPVEPTAEMQKQIIETGLQQCLETFRKTGRIIDFGNVNYQLLVDRGLINLTCEQKREIYAMADWEIRREKETQELSLAKQLQQLRNPGDNKMEIIARAKELSLRKYFDQLAGKPGDKPESRAAS